MGGKGVQQLTSESLAVFPVIGVDLGASSAPIHQADTAAAAITYEDDVGQFDRLRFA